MRPAGYQPPCPQQTLTPPPTLISLRRIDGRVCAAACCRRGCRRRRAACSQRVGVRSWHGDCERWRGSRSGSSGCGGCGRCCSRGGSGACGDAAALGTPIDEVILDICLHRLLLLLHLLHLLHLLLLLHRGRQLLLRRRCGRRRGQAGGGGGGGGQG